MAVALDLADIQGNILSAYGKLGFPKGRFITLHVDDPASGAQVRQRVAARDHDRAAMAVGTATKSRRATIAVPRPEVAVNIAFSWYGLLALGIPIRTLRGMPDEFIDGMMERAPMLGDDFSGPRLEEVLGRGVDVRRTNARSPIRIRCTCSSP